MPPPKFSVIILRTEPKKSRTHLAHGRFGKTLRTSQGSAMPAHAAVGEVLTIDADIRMSADARAAIDRALSSCITVGRGTAIQPERSSPGAVQVFNPWIRICRISGGMFWCCRRDFESIGGFDGSPLSAGGVDSAKRLEAYGKRVKDRSPRCVAATS